MPRGKRRSGQKHTALDASVMHGDRNDDEGNANLSSEMETVKGILIKILDEIKTMNANSAQRDAQIKELQESNQMLRKTLAQQQRFLETLDEDRRATNIIVLGLPEDVDMPYGERSLATDEEKWQGVLEEIAITEPIVVDNIQRLGKVRSNGPRPTKITLRNAFDRQKILQSAKKLDNSPEPFKSIYLKKDTHPAVRREMGRLWETFRKEKNKPENESRTVEFNRRNRQVLVDGQVVDSYKPSFF